MNDKLTPRELEIVKWKARGCTVQEIAEHMQISPKTVKGRIGKIYDKLNVDNAIQMLRKLNEEGVDVWNL
jgi:DNA-binding NarL/FixJ family response regulator